MVEEYGLEAGVAEAMLLGGHRGSEGEGPK